jgi:hypothetical protein
LPDLRGVFPKVLRNPGIHFEEVQDLEDLKIRINEKRFPILFCDIREEISDGLYDDPHRILRFVHVWAEMASIPREKMRCLASLRRSEYGPIFFGEYKRAPLSRHIGNKADGPQNLGQPAKSRRILPVQVQSRLRNAIRAGHDLPIPRFGQFDDKGRLPFRVVSGGKQYVRVKEKADQRL